MFQSFNKNILITGLSVYKLVENGFLSDWFAYLYIISLCICVHGEDFDKKNAFTHCIQINAFMYLLENRGCTLYCLGCMRDLLWHVLCKIQWGA